MKLDENEFEDDEDTEWGLEDDFDRMLSTILLLMMNSRTEYYVISFISKFNLLFLVTLVMFRKNKNKDIKFLAYCLDKK